MKKILFITSWLDFSDGVANVLKSLVNELSARDVDVTIYALYRVNPSFSSGIDSRVHIRKKFPVYFRGLTRLADFFGRFLARRDKLLRNESFDVIVSFEKRLASLMGAYCVPPNRSVRKIAVAHGWDYGNCKILDRFEKTIAVSEDIAVYLRKKVDFPERIVHVVSIYDFSHVEELSNAPLESSFLDKIRGHFVFCSVASLAKRKRFDRLLRAFSTVCRQKKDVLLLIVGDGPEKNKLIALSKKLGVEKQVLFLGRRSNPYPFIKISNCFVCSSDWEGLSTSCVEASLLHKPIVTTDVCGSSEIVRCPDIGIVTSKTSESLAQGMLLIYESPRFSGDVFDLANKKWDKNTNFEEYLHYLFPFGA